MEYKELYLPNHHRAKTNGCVDEHIIIAEKSSEESLKKAKLFTTRTKIKETMTLKTLWFLRVIQLM